MNLGGEREYREIYSVTDHVCHTDFSRLGGDLKEFKWMKEVMIQG